MANDYLPRMRQLLAMAKAATNGDEARAYVVALVELGRAQVAEYEAARAPQAKP